MGKLSKTCGRIELCWHDPNTGTRAIPAHTSSTRDDLRNLARPLRMKRIDLHETSLQRRPIGQVISNCPRPHEGSGREAHQLSFVADFIPDNHLWRTVITFVYLTLARIVV